MSKQSKKQQHNNTKSDNPKFNVFAFGRLELTVIIEFNDNDLIDKKGNKIKLENINDVNQLEFIKDNKDLINRIKLESENDFIKQFILLSKTSKTNKQIEFFSFYFPKFDQNSSFKNIFDEVANRYGILFNKVSLDKKRGYQLQIKLIHKKYSNVFEYISSDKETEMDIAKESPIDGSQPNKEENESNDDDDEEETCAMKKGLIPKFKNKECIFRKLHPYCQRYDLMYIDYNNLKNLEGGFEEEEFIELVKFFKEKKTKIFINYYNSSKSEFADPPDEDDDEDGEENEEKDEENKDEDKKENISENKDENNEEEEKSKSKKFSNLKKINLLYNLTDIYFFDEKQAYELFDRHLKVFGQDKTVNNLNKTKIYDYFITSIAGNSKNSEEKIGLFLKDLETFTIVKCSKKTGTKEVLDSKLYPQKTARNIDLINKYKSLVQENKDEYYNIFISLMLGALTSNNKNTCEEINLSFTNALTIIKKEIECIKNNMPFNMAKLIDYKTLQKGNRENRKNYAEKEKEKGFILDCTNNEKSKLKEYLSLKDKNLKWHFRNKNNMKYLVEKGFVDKQGYIMYDKEYRSIFRSPNNKIKKTDNANNRNNKSLSKIILETSLKNNINNPGQYLQKENIRTEEKVAK